MCLSLLRPISCHTDGAVDVCSKDIVVAAGLHKDIKDKYFRVGHMGVSVVDTERGDLDRVIKGVKEAFAEAGYKSS